jgi:hypothetical protein
MTRLHKIKLASGGEAYIDPKLITCTYRELGNDNWIVVVGAVIELEVDGAVHAYLLQHAE